MGRIYRPIVLHYGKRNIHVVAFVDSGADTSLISRRVADKLKIKATASSSVRLADGREIPTKKALVVVESARDDIKHELAVDISDAPFDEDIDEIDMIIGLDFLQKNGVKLIFQEPKINKRKAKSD